jgi:SAM-dependent methyltransferase
VDLGASPLANAYLKPDEAYQGESFYPLHAYVCENCFLVQLPQVCSPQELFADYSYFSSYSDTWLEHAKAYAQHIVGRFGIDVTKQVVEIGSNDGYLLQYFQQRGVPALGVEPARNVARVAQARGIPTVVEFFDRETATQLAAEGKRADLLVANNVLAHVPDLNGFVSAMQSLLKPRGIITAEFHHLVCLMAENQFDTIYHEHLCYFSFTVVEKVFAAHGLTLFDVEQMPTHGGSLRVYARRADDDSRPVAERVRELRQQEVAAGMTRLEGYDGFAPRVRAIKHQLLRFLLQAKHQFKSVVGYGAPAKGNTLLNYCGIRADLLDYTVDRSPHKQGHLLPGSHIAVFHPDRIRQTKPDYVLILPWNLKDEIMAQMAYVREWGGRFVVPIPDVQVLP